MPEMQQPHTLQLMKQLRELMLDITSQRFDDVNSHLAYLLGQCRSALAVNRVSLWIFERGGQRLRLRAMADDGVIPSDTPSLIDRVDCPAYFTALRSNFCVDVTDARTDPRTVELCADYLKPAGIVSMMDCPVRAFGEQVGVVCVEHARAANASPTLQALRPWHILEQSFATGIATQVTLVLERDELSQANASLVKRVLFDARTQLPNYLHLEDALKEALGDLGRGAGSFAAHYPDTPQLAPLGVGLVYADIEQFLLLSNSLGQAIAQSLLVALAHRLRTVAGEVFVARAGDDDFALIVRSATPLADAKALAERLIASMSEPLSAQGRDVICPLSIGYTARDASDGDLNAESMLREGWTASRAARRSGQPRVFERAQLIRVALEVELEQELRIALREGQFEPHLQAIFDVEARKIVGFEALMRWRQPQRGIITPIEFLGVAQRTGLIVPMGQQLLSCTLTQFASLVAAHPQRQLTLFFNMSPPEFLRDSLLQEITAELARTGLLPKHLALEITESVIIEDMPKAHDTMLGLQQLGIRVHLDDLGTGYSSLNYLRVLPVDGIKLDYSFTHDIERNPRSAALVKSLADLSVALAQDAVAEGVEWEGQLSQLKAFGIKLVQGFLLARPTPMPEITPEWIQTTEARAEAIFARAGAAERGAS
jgi:predicted signal transduction protein with EAL and GGDEF domain